jgi:hypothetical protein
MATQGYPLVTVVLGCISCTPISFARTSHTAFLDGGAMEGSFCWSWSCFMAGLRPSVWTQVNLGSWHTAEQDYWSAYCLKIQVSSWIVVDKIVSTFVHDELGTEKSFVSTNQMCFELYVSSQHQKINATNKLNCHEIM